MIGPVIQVYYGGNWCKNDQAQAKEMPSNQKYKTTTYIKMKKELSRVCPEQLPYIGGVGFIGNHSDPAHHTPVEEAANTEVPIYRTLSYSSKQELY